MRKSKWFKMRLITDHVKPSDLEPQVKHILRKHYINLWNQTSHLTCESAQMQQNNTAPNISNPNTLKNTQGKTRKNIVKIRRIPCPISPKIIEKHMTRSRQPKLLSTNNRIPDGQSLGGTLRTGKRKLMRPIVTKSPMHIVIRSSRARGKWSLMEHKPFIRKLLKELAERYGIKIFQDSNVGNHLHLLVQVRCREDLQNFLRVFSALIARKVTGAKKCSPQGKFWDHLVYTRIVNWGQDFHNTLKYVIANAWEALGILKRYKPHPQLGVNDSNISLTGKSSSGNPKKRTKPPSTVFLFDELSRKGAIGFG